MFLPFSSLALADVGNIPRTHKKQLGKYQIFLDQKLGSGFSSDAYIGLDTESEKLVCIKTIDREVFKSQTQKKMLSNEIKCQKQLQSDYIIKILDVFDTNSFCFVVTELCEDGDLFKLIQFSRYGLPEPLVLKLAYNLSEALLTMKESKIIHRDIKSQNVLLKYGIAKLGDFGFAVEEKELKNREDTSIGSPLYMPLQSLLENKYSYQSDIFSFGIVLYQMLHGRSPWQCNQQNQLVKKMKTEPITFKQGVSENLKKIIMGCLEMQAQKRITIQKVVQNLKQLKEKSQTKALPQKEKLVQNQIKVDNV